MFLSLECVTRTRQRVHAAGPCREWNRELCARAGYSASGTRGGSLLFRGPSLNSTGCVLIFEVYSYLLIFYTGSENHGPDQRARVYRAASRRCKQGDW